jgi:hypothetical protein
MLEDYDDSKKTKVTERVKTTMTHDTAAISLDQDTNGQQNSK